MARRRHKSSEEELSYWLSYSDMMAALLLIFVLIISFTMLQAKSEYEAKEQELLKQQELINEQQIKMQEQQVKMQEQQEILSQQETQILIQKEEMEGQKLVLEKQQIQLDKIIGVRSNLVGALKQEFEGSDLKLSVDAQTGAITFDSNILFDFGKYEIKEEGKVFLKEFLPRYLGVLLEDSYQEYVSEIIIEGHTDTEGSYMLNLELSQERALAVAKFCLNENDCLMSNEEILTLQKMVTANGRSFSNLIYNVDGTVNMDASRRVEFKFRLKDEEMIQEMSNVFAEE